MHTSYYTNGIYAEMVDGTHVGFYNWLDNAECYIGDERIIIKDAQHLDAILNLMKAIIKVSNYDKL